MAEVFNARIKDTFLGIEDHGIFTAFVHVEWQGSGCGFGGYSFGGSDPSIASGYGSAFIQNVLNIADVQSWEELKGKFIRIEVDDRMIKRIGHLMKDEWFDPKELGEKFRNLK